MKKINKPKINSNVKIIIVWTLPKQWKDFNQQKEHKYLNNMQHAKTVNIIPLDNH